MELLLRDRTMQFDGRRPLLMGILNVGNDSVADSRDLHTIGERVARGLALVADGATLIDIGAVSGRTDTPTISTDAEIELLTPVVRELADSGAIVSVDTWRAPVVAAVLTAGAQIINDVSGLADLEVARLAADARAGLVVMHTCAPPKERAFPRFDDPTQAVHTFLEQKLDDAVANGVDRRQLIIDPGLDYTKTPAESITVLRELDHFAPLDRPLLLAVSRKYFVGMLTGSQPTERLAGTLAAIGHGVAHGAAILRVHDVRAVRDYLDVATALSTEQPIELRGDPDDDSLKWIAPKS